MMTMGLPLHIDHLPAEAGTYCLWLALARPLSLRVGRLGEQTVWPGLYAYTGSALGRGGLHARVGRHLQVGKPLRWHIDYLTAGIRPRAVWYRTGADRLECAWSAALRSIPGAQVPLPGFGSSDCVCPAHLIAVPWQALGHAWQALNPDAALGALETGC